jgi:hypothetical protein
MRQTLHIFKKDARHLRWEIALVLLLMAGFAFSDARLDGSAGGHEPWNRILKLLVMLAWFILIARAIQSEALAGDKQFWLTRPYSWKSLLAAKILFLLVFITLPLMIADSVIVTVQGFSVSQHLPGLIWMQALWWTQFVLPIAVLAAITSGLTTTVFWAVVIIAAGLSSATQDLADPLGSLEWIYNSIYLSVAPAAVVGILVWQYARRRTVSARIVFGCSMALGSLAPLLPLSAALSLREPASLTVGVDPRLRPATRTGAWPDTAEVDFPLRIAGVPQGLTLRTDFTQVRIESSGERKVWLSNPTSNSDHAFVREEGDVFWLQISMDRKFLERVKNRPARIRVLLLLTLFGNQKTITLPPRSQSIPVPEVGMCNTDLPDPYLYRCRAPFRGPRFRLATQGDVGLSYTPLSPFPAELGISPMWSFANIVYGVRGPQEVPVSPTLILEEPRAHLRRVLTLDNIRMGDY